MGAQLGGFAESAGRNFATGVIAGTVQGAMLHQFDMEHLRGADVVDGVNQSGASVGYVRGLTTVAQTAGNLAASAFEVGVFGETTVNVAPIQGVGTVALTFDRDGYAGGAISQGGRQLDIAGALRGMGAYAMERDIVADRARLEFVNNYDQNTDPAA
ncbi:MAG: hypothetical protein MJA84_13890, partial [Firmicutes bacterium]|nr:hypothetical protein [Bacillota bacterium]